MNPPNLATTCFVVTPQLALAPEPIRPTLYGDLDADYDGFRGCLLIAEHAFKADWAIWEMHPCGDELLYLLEGRCRLHLASPEGRRWIPFETPGSVVRIPAGVWHTAEVAEACRILFITPGEGTRNATEPELD